MIKRLFIFMLYLLFALCVTALFLIVLFPRDRISSWAAAAVESRMPGFAVSVDDIRYVHPLKIRLYGITLVNEFQQIEVPLDTLLLTVPATWPLEEVGVSGVVFGGSVSGDITLDGLKKSGKIDIENLDISNLRFEEIQMLGRGIDRPLRGAVSFSGHASLKPERLDTLRMTGDVYIRDFSAPLRRPVFGETELFFDEVTAEMSLSSGILQLSAGSAKGTLLNGEFSGTIKTAALWRNRLLALTGSIVPQPDLYQDDPALTEALDLYFRRYNTRAIPFTVAGTLREPEISFSDSAASAAAQTN